MDITNEHRVAVAGAETHAVFWYIHIEPYRRHALMLSRDGRVMLLSRYGDFNSEVSRSDWHGEHTFFTRVTEDFTVVLHYRGSEGHFLRRLHLRPDLVYADGHTMTWVAYHVDLRHAWLVYAGNMTVERVQDTLNRSRRLGWQRGSANDTIPATPPPPPRPSRHGPVILPDVADIPATRLGTIPAGLEPIDIIMDLSTVPPPPEPQATRTDVWTLLRIEQARVTHRGPLCAPGGVDI